MNFFNSIKNLNYFDFKNNLNNKNLTSSFNELNPLEYLFDNFNDDSDLHSAILISQTLINNNVDKSAFKEIDPLELSSQKRLLFKHILNAQKHSSTFENIQKENNTTEYSQQELLHLKNYAKKFNISDNEKHLALRIIKHLINLKSCPNCNE